MHWQRRHGCRRRRKMAPPTMGACGFGRRAELCHR